MSTIYKPRTVFIVFLMMLFGTLANGQENDSSMLRDLDIPLMDGLEEDIDEALVFDSPDGRIISAQASGGVNGKAAFDYYLVVLPSLGWKINLDHRSGLICDQISIYCLSAIRDQEILTLNVSGVRQSATINYALSPN